MKRVAWVRCVLSLAVMALGAVGCGEDGEGVNSVAADKHIRTVFLILMENKNLDGILANANAPYLNNTLVPISSYTDNYKGPNDGTLHPSEPNYIWLEAGDNFGITNDDDPDANHRPETDHLVTLLEKAGVSWRSYQEDITADVCPLTGIANYEPKHNPMVFFDDVINYNTQTMSADPLAPRCVKNIRPFSELTADLQNNKVARYNFLTPNQCNDMHSPCAPLRNPVKQGDNWLAQWIPVIQASQAYKDNGVIIIAWDEAELSRTCLADCPIPFLILSPLAKGGGYHNSIRYDHSSTLKSLQEIFHVSPLLRHAGDEGVEDLRDLFETFP